MWTLEVQKQKKQTKTDVCIAMAERQQLMTLNLRGTATLIVLGLFWTFDVTADISTVQRRKWSADDTVSLDRYNRDTDNNDQLQDPMAQGIMERLVQISPEEQRRILIQLRANCLRDNLTENTFEFPSSVVAPWDEDEDVDGGPEAGRASCERTWDDISCWPETPAGQLAVLPCPIYINNFHIDGVATRQCMDNGQWYFHTGYNKTWTNYSLCIGSPPTPPPQLPALLVEHLNSIRLIYYVGYSLSLVVRLVAVTIMLSLRKLRCPRNSLHINLFFSFILRALLALSRDMIRSEKLGISTYREDASSWQCRLLTAVFNFAMVANYSWIFVEGLYLHTVLFVTVFSETTTVVPYVVFGWTTPLVTVVTWAIVRMTFENIHCWNAHQNRGYFWIIKGPVIVLSTVNFCFFLNVIRVLFTKLRAFNSPDSRKYRHWKLTKSTLVLIPLFGVPYIVFVAWQENIDPLIELIKLYFEMTFNSCNGIIVSILYCFFNGEVQSELRKKWQCYREVNPRGRRRDTTIMSSMFASRSCHQSFRSATGNSTVMLDHDDQLGTGYELSPGPIKCARSGGLNHVRHPSNTSWNSDSSAIQLKTLDRRAGEEGGTGKRLGGGDAGGVGGEGEEDPLQNVVTSDDEGAQPCGSQQQETDGQVQNLIIVIDN